MLPYSQDFEQAMQYNASQDDVHILLSSMKEEHRHPADFLQVERAATSDALAEIGRDKEAGYLADPTQHVMILPHPDTKQLEVHPALFQANPMKHDSIIHDNTQEAVRALHGLSNYSGEYGDHIDDVTEGAGHNHLIDYRDMYSNMDEDKRQEHGVPNDWETNDDAVLPPLPKNHHRVFYHYQSEDPESIPYYHQDVHVKNMPKHLADHLDNLAEETQFWDNPEDTDPQEDNEPSNADNFVNAIDRLRDTPVERSLTTSELNKLKESQET